MNFLIAAVLFLTFAVAVVSAQEAEWRKMTETELRRTVPEKAPVIRENIETEFRTASGIARTDQKQIFGVVIITAGYEAEGKYTHFLKTGATMRIGETALAPGEYLFGYQRINAETLRVMFYRAQDGELVGATRAKVEKRKGAIYSFLIEPPSAAGGGKIYIGRFTFDYVLE